MPLSEHEQRILDEIERRLAAEDPKFARSVSVRPARPRGARTVKSAALGFLTGFGLLVAGLFLPELLVPFGLAAFAIMLASVVIVTGALKRLGQERAGRQGRAPAWFARLEERWRKRFERGDE